MITICLVDTIVTSLLSPVGSKYNSVGETLKVYSYGIQGSSAGTALANMIRYLQLSLADQKKKGFSDGHFSGAASPS